MLVFKFGGASVKDAQAVINVSKIIEAYKEFDLIIVVSAMGKTTNAFEKLVNAYFYQPELCSTLLAEIKHFHEKIMADLFPSKSSKVWEDVNNYFVEAEWVLEEEMNHGYDHTYDQLVSLGELISTRIVSHYLNEHLFEVEWIDARDFVITDNTYREADILWEESQRSFNSMLSSIPRVNNKVKGITQGFIGCTTENFTTTLGREGSDFTAAIIAFLSDASEVIIWKDVDGVLTADPRKFSDAELISHLSYHDAVELTYYGATVIHPKTIKPLQNKLIPLRVKSFENPLSEGTLIDNTISGNHLPCIIHKANQILISFSVKDFSFVAENHLSKIFNAFSQHGYKLNLMQLSALSFSVCVDEDNEKIGKVLSILKEEFKILFNKGLDLFTIRYYNNNTIQKISSQRSILLEQRSRQTIQLVALPK